MKTKARFYADLAFFGVLLSILVLSAGGHIVSGDEETMFRVTQNLLAGRGLAVGREEIVLPAQDDPLFLPHRDEPSWTTSAVLGRDGLAYSKYGIGQSLAAIPLYLIGDLWGRAIPMEERTRPEGWYARLFVAMLNPLALAGCGWLLVCFGRALGYQANTSRWVAVAAIFSTMMWPYVKTFYPQPWVAFLVTIAIYAAYMWRKTLDGRWLWGISLACGVAILFRLSSILILPAITLYLIFTTPVHRRWNWVVPLSMGIILALGITVGYNWIRFGSFFETGYHEVAWTTPPIMGLYGLLFSPGKGILFYAPMLVINLVVGGLFAHRHRAEFGLFVGLWLSYLAFYAPYDFWTGGFNWGPRFLLPILPLAFLPLGIVLEDDRIRGARTIFISLFVVGLMIQISAILVDHSRYLYQQFAASEDISRTYKETIFNLKSSPVIQQWPVALDLMTAYANERTWRQAHQSLQDIAGEPLDILNGHALLQSEFLRRNTLDFWWLHGRLLDSSYRGTSFGWTFWLLVGVICGVPLIFTQNGVSRAFN